MKITHCSWRPVIFLAPLLATSLALILLSSFPNLQPEQFPRPSKQNLRMSNNIESSLAPCGVCDREVSWSHKGINCDTCGLWFHAHCQDIGSRTYSNLNEEENQDLTWHCVICGNAKRSTTAFDLYGVERETSNIASYHENDLFRPNHCSTPTRVSRMNKQKFRPLRCINLNFRSVTGKKAAFINLVESVKPDIVIGTETHLDPTIKDAEYLPTGYKALRRDRNRDGGGILIAVREDLQITATPELETNCEILWAKICTPGKSSLYVCAFYRPDVKDKKGLEQFEISIKQKLPKVKNSNIIIAGDFNLPGLSWPDGTVTIKPGCSYPKLHEQFVELLFDSGLEQIVHEPTRGANCLDLVLTNAPDLVPRVEILPRLSDHEVVYFEFTTKITKAQNVIRPIPLYNKADWSNMKKELANLETRILEQANNSDVNILWKIFRETMQDLMKKYIPHKISRKKSSYPWINTEIKKQMRKRDRKYRLMKKFGTPELIEQVKQLCREVQRELRRAFWRYVENLFTPTDSESNELPSLKRFYTYMKQLRSSKTGIPPLKTPDSILVTDPKDKAELLNSQFNKAFSSGTKYNDQEFKQKCPMPENSNTFPTIADINITSQGVEKLLANTNPTKATGPDGIPPHVLKELSHELAPILTVIFQKSLNTGIVPSEWKEAIVSPIYKKGEQYNPANYRPVSLTSVPCKILEHIIVSHIMDFLENNNILVTSQHGFRKQRSCETQLLEFISELVTSLDQKQQTDVVVMDFAKAFDKVNHSLLVHKLRHYGIRNSINCWIADFLEGRSQCVVVEGSKSSNIPVKSGVPQGSVLGPCLFLIYINDLADCVSSTARLFADDTLLHRLVAAARDHETLQDDLQRLEQWEEKWDMAFHPDKCSVLSISRKKNISKHKYLLHGHELEHVTSAKYLGVTIQSDLKWNLHIDSIVKKANQMLGFLRRNLKINSISTKELAYKTFIRPLVEYACTVWDPAAKTEIAKIEMVQRRAARYVLNRHHNTSSVSQMLQTLKWSSLEQRRQASRLNMLFKISNDYVKVQTDELHQLEERARRTNSKAFKRITCSSDVKSNSFIPRTIREWNSLPEEIVSAPSVKAFSSRLNRHLTK